MSQPASPRSGVGISIFVILTLVFHTLNTAGQAHAEDLALLFNPPTEEELAGVRSDWAERPTLVSNSAIDRSATLDGFRMDRISFDYDGFHQYGLLRYPLDYTPGETFPVLMYLHGGFSGLWYNDPLHFDDEFPAGCLADSFFVVSPTYRGEALSGGELGNVSSEGIPEIWNREVDDSMAMLTAVLGLVNGLDSNRVVAYGQSRGGNVAYQLAVRDSRVRRTVVLFGPSQFRTASIQGEIQAYLDGTGDITTALAEKVHQEIVDPWLNGETDLASARNQLTNWSVCDFLPADLWLQVHHGLADESVSPEQSFIVQNHMEAFEGGSPHFSLHTYENGQHNPATLTGYEFFVEEIFCFLEGSVASAPVSPALGQLQVWPNPFAGSLTVRAEDSAKSFTDGDVLVAEVFDLRGCRVAEFLLMPGVNTTWQGRDRLGRVLPAGQYTLRIRNRPRFPARRILLMN